MNSSLIELAKTQSSQSSSLLSLDDKTLVTTHLPAY
ncbi:Uncharacterised protein [Vibrio cholerae]|nr:Uncharacterised protein [Vibrio cholerae]